MAPIIGTVVPTPEIIARRLDLDVRRSRAWREMLPAAIPGMVVSFAKRYQARDDLAKIHERR